MRLYVFLFSVFSILTSNNAISQDSEAFSFQPNKKRNHIGVNTHFPSITSFLGKSNIPIELMFRRQVNNKETAYRIGISFLHQYTQEGLSMRKGAVAYHDKTWRVFIGKEWQEKLSNRWYILYGMDVVGSLNQSRRLVRFPEQPLGSFLAPLTNLEDKSERETQIGFSPFLGSRFHISPKFYLSYTFHLEFLLGRVISNYFLREQMVDGELIETRTKQVWTTTSFSFQPYSGIFFNVLF